MGWEALGRCLEGFRCSVSEINQSNNRQSRLGQEASGGAPQVLDVLFLTSGGLLHSLTVFYLQVLGANVLSALVKAKLDQLKVDGVKTFLPGL